MILQESQHVRIVVLLNDASLELQIIGYIDAAAEGKKSVLETPLIGVH